MFADANSICPFGTRYVLSGHDMLLAQRDICQRGLPRLGGREKKMTHRPSNIEAKELTKEYLFEALIKLMKKMPFEKITVSELTKCAGVSRTAFYRHYSSIDQIIKEPLVGLISMLRTSLNEDKYKNDLRLWCVEMLSFLRSYADMLDPLLKATDGKFVDMKIIGKPFVPSDDSESARLRYMAFNGAIRSMLSEWVKDRCRGDVYELADIIVTLKERLL